jgi:hypothetical protein
MEIGAGRVGPSPCLGLRAQWSAALVMRLAPRPPWVPEGSTQNVLKAAQRQFASHYERHEPRPGGSRPGYRSGRRRWNRGP